MANRPGLPSTGSIAKPLRDHLEPIIDTLGRITASVEGVKKLLPVQGSVNESLVGTSTLAQTITRVNELGGAINTLRVAVNALISRLQED